MVMIINKHTQAFFVKFMDDSIIILTVTWLNKLSLFLLNKTQYICPLLYISPDFLYQRLNNKLFVFFFVKKDQRGQCPKSVSKCLFII